jgi:hypothetical protein
MNEIDETDFKEKRRRCQRIGKKSKFCSPKKLNLMEA